MLSGPNWSNAKTRSGNREITSSIRSSLASLAGSVRLLPGPGALKGDVVGVQDPPHPFPADPHDPVRHLCRVGAAVAAAEVVRELADAPVRKRQTQLPRASAGDLDHERLVLVGDPPRPPGAPVRLQHGQPVGVERVDHVPDRVRVRGDQPGDRQDRCPRRRRQDDQPPAVPDGVGTTPAAYQSQQELAFIVGQSTCPDRSGHDAPRSTPQDQECTVPAHGSRTDDGVSPTSTR